MAAFRACMYETIYLSKNHSRDSVTQSWCRSRTILSRKLSLFTFEVFLWWYNLTRIRLRVHAQPRVWKLVPNMLACPPCMWPTPHVLNVQTLIRSFWLCESRVRRPSLVCVIRAGTQYADTSYIRIIPLSAAGLNLTLWEKTDYIHLHSPELQLAIEECRLEGRLHSCITVPSSLKTSL